MNIENKSWTISGIKKYFETGTLALNHPIQRRGEQWDTLQKSKLIQTIFLKWNIIPPIVVERTFKEFGSGNQPVYNYAVLDGKQRITTILNFIDDNLKLSPDTPDAIVEEETIELAGKRYSDFNQDQQAMFKATSIPVCIVENATEAEIEDLFSRLNSGTPLSGSQKMKSLFGFNLVNFINDNVLSTPFFTETAKFNATQKKHEDEYVVVGQILMLLNDAYDWPSFAVKDVSEYVAKLKTLYGDNMAAFETGLGKELKDITNYLSEAFKDTDDKNMKKVNIPIIFYVASKAITDTVDPDMFKAFITDFFAQYTPKEGYAAYCGAGNVKKVNVEGRMNTMYEAYEKYFA